MALREAKSTLQRKVAGARERGGAHGDRSALRALRQALGRSSRDIVELPLSVIGATQSRASQDELLRHLDDDRLLILLDGPDGLSGVATLDLALISALIQQQTTGRVSPKAPEARAFTDTDAALAAPLLEDLLSRAAELTAVPSDRACLTGYRFGALAEDAQSLALTLEAERFRVFEMTIDIAAGQRQGVIGLVLPERESAVAPPARGKDKGNDGPHLGEAVMAAHAELRVILCRMHLPLAELSALRPGDVVPLVTHRLDKTELQSISGQYLTVGRLGQADGFRAIRLNESQLADEDNSAAPVGRAMPAVSDMRARQLALRTAPGDGSPGRGAASPEADIDMLDPDDLIDAMTPDQAAAEISELAGLSVDDDIGEHAPDIT